MTFTTRPLSSGITTSAATTRRVSAAGAAVLGLSLFLTVAVLAVLSGAGDAELRRSHDDPAEDSTRSTR